MSDAHEIGTTPTHTPTPDEMTFEEQVEDAQRRAAYSAEADYWRNDDGRFGYNGAHDEYIGDHGEECGCGCGW